MRRGVQSRCRCGRGGPSPVAGVGGVRPALVQNRAEAGRSGPWADVGGASPVPVRRWDAISPVSWQNSAEASPIPSQIGASVFADTSGKGSGCGAGLIMPLASIAGAPCCDHGMRRGVRSRCRCGRAEPRQAAGRRTDAPSRAAEHGRGRADQPQRNVARVSPVPVHCMLLTGAP